MLQTFPPHRNAQPGHGRQCGWKSDDRKDRCIWLMSLFYKRNCQYPMQQATGWRNVGIDWCLQGVRRSLIMLLLRAQPTRLLWMDISASNNLLLVVGAAHIFQHCTVKSDKAFSAETNAPTTTTTTLWHFKNRSFKLIPSPTFWGRWAFIQKKNAAYQSNFLSPEAPAQKKKIQKLILLDVLNVT